MRIDSQIQYAKSSYKFQLESLAQQIQDELKALESGKAPGYYISGNTIEKVVVELARLQTLLRVKEELAAE